MIATGQHRIVQIHPTLQCNLACEHCYSSSGPHRREAIDPDILIDAIQDVAAQGYDTLSLSGGEPLLYPGLLRVLEAADTARLKTTLTTNGTLLNPRRLGPVADRLSLLAISVDGLPSEHDRIRVHEGAFQQLVQGLDYVRELEIPFGFIVTLTRQSIHHLPWLVEFAVNQGAHLIQLHPLELAGRAAQRLGGMEPDHLDLGAAFAQVLELRKKHGNAIAIQLDAASQPAVENLMKASPPCSGSRLADYVSPLVIEADGRVIPLQYGFSPGFTLGNLHDLPLRELAPAWIEHRGPRFRSLLTTTADTRWWPERIPMANWYELANHVASEQDRTSSDPASTGQR